MFGLSELAILLIVVIVVFGAKKLPDLARSAGKAARILKSEAKAMKTQDSSDGPQGPEPRIIPGKAAGSNGAKPGDDSGAAGHTQHP
ncbi:twin-arginine translocase TatA/TatE family subunit [Streptomyces sp. Ru87]|uniref:twin-arginine translocase TatA/TatE family subunit n=1 Tax=Streptomyces sp. Ru87 TaxID=2044307 RepID=UPI000BF9EC7C|nr:twin-arginine translocase TatA/TatE family subunit [Streptomyces sp. Ru87]PGH47221.1 hypothetical protein CRI70_29705 [Streptomyces sp. Ru87]